MKTAAAQPTQSAAQAEALARSLFDALAELSADPPGVTRAAYGAIESAAHNLIAQAAEGLGAEIHRDAARNLFARFSGRYTNRPTTLIGSHLDSVPHGGNFDGAAGIVAGLAAMEHLKAGGERPETDVIIAVFRAEEAVWFPISYPGSLAALGQLPRAALNVPRSDTGRRLAEHMADVGGDPDAVGRGAHWLDQSRLGAMVELHIEQGQVLITRDQPVALVTGLAGGTRFEALRLYGTWAHSGAVPFGERRDAVVAAAEIVSEMQAVWAAIETEGRVATVTFGKIATDPEMNSGSRVPGQVEMCIDIRSVDAETEAMLIERLHAILSKIAMRHGLHVEPGPTQSWPAIRCDAALLDRLDRAGKRAGHAPLARMPSGGGHDAAAFAEAGIPTAMVFIRNTGGSHTPEEDMEIADFMVGVAVLAEYLRAPDG